MYGMEAARAEAARLGKEKVRKGGDEVQGKSAHLWRTSMCARTLLSDSRTSQYEAVMRKDESALAQSRGG
jgi:hypothetical protein